MFWKRAKNVFEMGEMCLRVKKKDPIERSFLRPVADGL